MNDKLLTGTLNQTNRKLIQCLCSVSTYLTQRTKSPFIDWLSRTKNTPLVCTFSNISFVSSLLSGPKYQLKQNQHFGNSTSTSSIGKNSLILLSIRKISHIYLKTSKNDKNIISVRTQDLSIRSPLLSHYATALSRSILGLISFNFII